MDLTRQHTQVRCVVRADRDEHVVREDAGIQKLEMPVLAGFNRGDVARQSRQLLAHFLPWFAEQPPVGGVASAVLGVAFGIALRLHPLHDPLVHRREPLPHGVGFESEEVDHLHAARPGRQILAVAVVADVLLQARNRAKTERLRFLVGDDEPRAVQFHPRR